MKRRDFIQLPGVTAGATINAARAQSLGQVEKTALACSEDRLTGK